MYLGIDLGTSEVKAVLVDDEGGLLASSGSPLEVSRPRPRWSEQAPEAWWQAALATVDGIAARRPAALAGLRGNPRRHRHLNEPACGAEEDPLGAAQASTVSAQAARACPPAPNGGPLR